MKIKKSTYLTFFLAVLLHIFLMGLIFFDWSIHREKSNTIIETYLYKKNLMQSNQHAISLQMKISRSVSPSHFEKASSFSNKVSKSLHVSKKTLSPFLILLHDKLQAELVYPEQAELLQLKGEVTLCFRINHQGKLYDLSFCPGSSYPFFNKAAEDAALAVQLTPLEIQQMDPQIFRVNLVFE